MDTLKQYWKFFVSVMFLILALFLAVIGFVTYIFDSENIQIDPDGVLIPNAFIDGFQNI